MSDLKIRGEMQTLSPSAKIELFELRTKYGEVFRFHAGTNKLGGSVVWQGDIFTPWAVSASGFEIKADGQAPRPTLEICDKLCVITELVDSEDDMRGAMVIRRRTLARFLDAVNFADGKNPDADATQEFRPDRYFIDRKSEHVPGEVVKFELVSVLDVQGAKFPRRQIVQNCCSWTYKSPECGYCGARFFDVNDKETTDPSKDKCSGTLKACKLRFGPHSQIPFGGFPAAGLVRL